MQPTVDTGIADNMQPTVVSMISPHDLNHGEVKDTGIAEGIQPTVVTTTSKMTYHPMGFPMPVEVGDSVKIHKALSEALQLLGAFASERNPHVA